MPQVEQLDLFTRMEALPWQALCDIAVEHDVPSDEAENKTKDELIEVLIQRGISSEQVKALMDRYAYGKTVTFTLWHLEGTAQEDMLQQLEALRAREIELGATGFRKLKVCDVSDRGNRAEVVYKYSKKHMYLDESGMEQIVWEQHIGCVWIGKDKPYLAVIGKDEKVWSRIADVISSTLSRRNTPVRPPQRAIDRCFAEAKRSKVTLVGQDGDRVTIARAEGFTPEQEMDADRYAETRKRVSGGFKTSIGEHQNVSARFNATRGNITIQKYLPAEDLFAWTEDAITIILEEIHNLKGKPAKEVFAAVGKDITWPGILPEYHISLDWLLTQLLSGSSESDTVQMDIPNSISGLLEDKRYFIAAYRPHCQGCEAPVAATCNECNTVLTVYDVKGGTCPNCGPLIDAGIYRLYCSDSHPLPLYNVNHCWFIPTPGLISKIDTNLQKVVPSTGVAYRWYVGNMQLVIHPERARAHEIPFSSIAEFNLVPGVVTNARKQWITTLKEKCSKSSTKACTECVGTIKELCLMRIFHPVIPGYRPQPHRGGEYGDVSGQLMVNGHPFETKGVIKSNTKKKPEDRMRSFMLSSSTAGQEIIRQIVEQGLADARCNIIAIIAPQYIDAGFKGTLRFLCGLGGKNITFWELDELCHIVEAFKQSVGTSGQPIPTVVSVIP